MEGIFTAPEGAATWAAFKKLAGNQWISSGERVILFNTGSGLKYLDSIDLSRLEVT
jgi:threonine synthase